MSVFDIFKKNEGTPQNQFSSNAVLNQSASKLHSSNTPTLADRIRNARPSEAGLYPHEILMLSYANTFTTGQNNFQKFWLYDYSVDSPQQLLNSLFSRGFICPSSVDYSLSKLPVADLKSLLTKVNEKTSGKKSDLIERILTAYSQQQLEKMFPIRYFQLSPKGETEVSQNEYVLYLHRHHYMTVWDMNYTLKATNTDAKHFRDIIWREFNRQSIDHMKNGDFGLYRNTRLDMHDFVLEEKKYRSALQLLCEVISYDLSGHGNGEANQMLTSPTMRNIIFENRMTNFIKDTSGKEVAIPPGIIKSFEALYKNLEVSSEEFAKIVYQLFGNIRIHERIFSAEESANIALSSIGLEKRKCRNSFSVAQQRMKSLLNM